VLGTIGIVASLSFSNFITIQQTIAFSRASWQTSYEELSTR
jgi:hypothetical protein